MAPDKRRRTIDDDGDAERSSGGEDVLDVQSARSVQRKSRVKKSKTAIAQENGGSVVSDDESDFDANPPALSGINDYGDASSESEDEADVMRDMQEDLEELMRMDKENQPADHGVVEEVYCQNFMCHAKLRIKLGPLINFIIGHNGSGKSAVLTALTLCLGVKATATNRGASLKKFIKEGQESAMLSVKIKNQGDMSYQPELYGDSIIVERHFNKSGASQFKIKSAEGRLISTKRAELEDMLDFLGLQLDNPLNVLSQDLARQFLSNSSAADKYKFFMKGTQLEQLDRDYSMMHDFVDQTEAKCAQREEDIAHLKRKLENAEKKKQDMDKIATIREKIKALEWMHAWAQVEAVEREVDSAQKAVDDAEDLIERRQRESDAKSENYDSKHADLEAAKGVKQDAEQDLDPAKKEFEEAKDAFDKGTAALSENNITIRHIKTDLKGYINDVNKHKASIEEEQRRIADASGPAQAEKLAQLQEAEAEAEEKRAARNISDRRDLDEERSKAQEEVNKKADSRQPAQDKVQAAERMLRDLNSDQGNHIKAFHPKTPNLLRAIQDERGFRKKPVGPLGMHVKLKKPEWSSIVETTFGGMLDAYVVTSAQDQALLRTLQQRHGCHSDIYIGDPRPLDVSEKRAMTDEDTLLTLLDIDNELARNQFIINQAAEQTVFIKSRSEAVALNLLPDQERPRNIKSIICMHDTIRNEGHRYAKTANGPRVDRVKPWIRSPRLKTDLAAQIRHQQETVADAKRALNAVDQDVRQAEMRLKHANEAIKRYERQQRDLRIESQQADARVEELKEELERFTVDAGTLEAIKQQLREAEEAKALCENSYTDATVEKENMNDSQRVLKREVDRTHDALKEVEARLKKIDGALNKKTEARQTALREKNLAIGLLEEAQKNRDELQAAKEERESHLVDFTEQASQICPRVPVENGLDADKIDARLDKLKKQQQAQEAEVGASREEIAMAFINARQEYREARKGLMQISAVAKRLKEALMLRKSRWRVFRKYIIVRAKIMFSFLLHQRGFQGRLIVNHGEDSRTERGMDIAVEPDTTRNSDKGRQAKTLSGGEKSFSTICLLLAIWEAMGSPIRCLDEFDVFMDNVNRDTSMRLMIEAARRASGKQYILITPQSMNNVLLKEDVKLHKMSDPERGQTALNF